MFCYCVLEAVYMDCVFFQVTVYWRIQFVSSLLVFDVLLCCVILHGFQHGFFVMYLLYMSFSVDICFT